MGNTWISEELMRRMIIQDFPRHKKIIFPQTIYYSDTPIGQHQMDESIGIYNTENILMFARDRVSYAIMKNLYPLAKILFCPDMFLFYENPCLVAEHKGKSILLCLRSDKEKALSIEDVQSIMSVLQSNNLKYRLTDMHHTDTIDIHNRSFVITKKLCEFSSSKLVVTDRLHGMLFSVLTGTPCIVFGNFNHKISGVYEYVSHLKYIRYIDSVDEFSDALLDLLLNNCWLYDNTQLNSYFKQARNVVINYSKN